VACTFLLLVPFDHEALEAANNSPAPIFMGATVLLCVLYAALIVV
jgi:hypothetical protein